VRCTKEKKEIAKHKGEEGKERKNLLSRSSQGGIKSGPVLDVKPTQEPKGPQHQQSRGTDRQFPSLKQWGEPGTREVSKESFRLGEKIKLTTGGGCIWGIFEVGD